MRKVVVLILCLVALCAALWRSTSPRQVQSPVEAVASSSSPPPVSPPSIVLADPVDRSAARTEPSPTIEPADSVAIASPAAQPIGNELAPSSESAELERLRAERDRLLLELELCRNPERTPLGALVRLPEYPSMDEQARQFLNAVMADDLPVVLRAGEGAWIAERLQRKDWTLYGSSSMGAIIQFLGPSRVAAEVPPQKLQILRQLCAPDEWALLFGNR